MHICGVFLIYFEMKYWFLAKYVHHTILLDTFKMATISGYGHLNVSGYGPPIFFS